MRHPLCFVAVGAIIAGGQQIGAQPAYTIQHIPGLQNNFFVARISDSGHVVAGHHLWYQGTITDLGGLGGNFTAVEGVNAIGQVVGRSSAANGYMQPFLWQNGIMRALPNLGGEEGYATAINNAGQVVGYTDNISGGSVSNHRATFWTASGIALDLGALPPDLASRAHAINNLGQVVGISMPSPSSSFGGDAVFWSGGNVTPFIQNEDPGFIVTADLNDLGQVVGLHYTNAYLWQDGVMTTLGTLGGTFSFAEGINNTGEIVGRSSIAQGPLRAFIFENGQMIDINSRVVDLSEWEYLSSASDINESGQIVGFGRLRGGFSDNEVFLLTPVPEPSSALLLLSGFVLSFRSLCRKRCGQS